MADPLWVPDISHHQAGISIQGIEDAGAAALIARVGQGAGRLGTTTYGTTRDREWARHRDEARRVGLPLVAYWYVGNLISAADNADLAKAWVGDTTIPWMIDHENASGNLAFYREVVAEFQERGLRVILGYVPRWYWSGTGGRAPLVPGPPLVNSAYRGGPGTAATIYKQHNAADWSPYGGGNVLLLQFTNQAQMAGRKIDCSAFRGSKAELLALINGTPAVESATTKERTEDVIITCETGDTSDTNKAGILSGGMLFDITDDPGARGFAQSAINRGIVAEIRVTEATWNKLWDASHLTSGMSSDQ
jgi:lysozyme